MVHAIYEEPKNVSVFDGSPNWHMGSQNTDLWVYTNQSWREAEFMIDFYDFWCSCQIANILKKIYKQIISGQTIQP